MNTQVMLIPIGNNVVFFVAVVVNNVGMSYELPTYLHELEDNKVVKMVLDRCC